MSRITNKSYNRISLARKLRAVDFYKYSELNLLDESIKYRHIDEILEQSEKEDPDGIIINLLQVGRKKPMYTAGNLGTRLLFRKTQENLNHLRSPTKSRNRIIRELKQILKDGSKYRLYKLDISKFFENVSVDHLNDAVGKLETTTQTKDIVRKVLKIFNDYHGKGLPRGIEFSPTLAEIILEDFDDSIIALENVFYYSRFVDDIILITDGDEDQKIFLRKIKKYLPGGLTFNYNKKYIVDLDKHSQSNQVVSFDHLGYQISIRPNGSSNNECKKNFRAVRADLSENKRKQISGKIIKSFYAYYKDNDFYLLLDRITFLATNRNIIDQSTKRIIPTGIYYNHPEVSLGSQKIDQLDKLVKMLTLSPQERISNCQTQSFSKAQKKSLLKISFSRSFRKRVFKRYSPNRLNKIAKIWK